MSEAQGEASWSRIERMRKEMQLQRDAQAMRIADKEARRDRKIKWDEETVMVSPGHAQAQESQGPSHVEMDLAREKVQAQAFARPQVQPHTLPQSRQMRAEYTRQPAMNTHAHARAHAFPTTREAQEKLFIQGPAQQTRNNPQYTAQQPLRNPSNFPHTHKPFTNRNTFQKQHEQKQNNFQRRPTFQQYQQNQQNPQKNTFQQKNTFPPRNTFQPKQNNFQKPGRPVEYHINKFKEQLDQKQSNVQNKQHTNETKNQTSEKTILEK